MTMPIDQSGLDLLITPEDRLITLTGAGGKSSLSRWLSSHLRLIPRSVIITTTTKILPLPGVKTVLDESGPNFMDRIRNALAHSPCIVVASRFDQTSGKLTGLDKDKITTLHNSGLADTILVEADGAARKPLKAPNRHEPVIPLETDLCIGVMGLDAVYRPWTEANVHRHEIFSRITNLPPGENVTPEHLFKIATAPNGLFKGCPPDCDLKIFLNKTDIPNGHELVKEFKNILITGRQPMHFKWFAGSVAERHLREIEVISGRKCGLTDIQLVFSQKF